MAMSMLVLADPARTSHGPSGEPSAVPPAFDKVLPAILRVHESAGGIIGHLWRLPPEVTLVISSHHKLPPVRDNAMSAAVAIADWIATELGFGVAGERDSLPKDAVRLLGLSDVALADIQAQVRGILARVL